MCSKSRGVGKNPNKSVTVELEHKSHQPKDACIQLDAFTYLNDTYKTDFGRTEKQTASQTKVTAGRRSAPMRWHYVFLLQPTDGILYMCAAAAINSELFHS